MKWITYQNSNGWYRVKAYRPGEKLTGTTFRFYQHAKAHMEHLNKARAKRIYRKNHPPIFVIMRKWQKEN